MLAESIFSVLSIDAGVQSALGVATAPFPIYPNRAPDGQGVPFVVFQLVAGVVDATQNDSGQFEDALYQFSVFATSYLQARDIRKAIFAALAAVTQLPDGSKLTLETQRDLYEAESDAHHCILEVRFLHDPTV